MVRGPHLSSCFPILPEDTGDRASMSVGSLILIVNECGWVSAVTRMLGRLCVVMTVSLDFLHKAIQTLRCRHDAGCLELLMIGAHIHSDYSIEFKASS